MNLKNNILSQDESKSIHFDLTRRHLLKSSLVMGLTSFIYSLKARAGGFIPFSFIKKMVPTVTPFVDDVFSIFLYNGTGTTQTVTNGLDLSSKGGLIWLKMRDTSSNVANFPQDHMMITVPGNNELSSNTTAASIATNKVSAVSNSGFTITNNAGDNTKKYVSWTFTKANKFFDYGTVTKTAGTNASVSFASLGTLGMVLVKRTDSTGSWYAWHRSLTNGKLVYFEQTSGEANLGHITVTGTTVNLVNGVIADGTYMVQAFAHDSAPEGIIQCGTYGGLGTTAQLATLNWEPQFLCIKRIDSTGNWWIQDVSRGSGDISAGSSILYSNLNNSESTGSNGMCPLATGFKSFSTNADVNISGCTYIYMAIRRSNKKPTAGSQVFTPTLGNSTAATGGTIFTANHTVDLFIGNDLSAGYSYLQPRQVLPANYMTMSSSVAEQVSADWSLTNIQNGVGYVSARDCTARLAYMFKRALGFMDVVCDTGTGAVHTLNHNLGVAPELIIRKSRSAATQWEVWHKQLLNSEKLVFNSTAAKTSDTTAWNSTNPTASVFTVGTGANVNTSASTYITTLFASLPGVSLVSSFTGDGTSSKSIVCGFQPRFILMKAIDSTSGWIAFNSARGILTGGSDPYFVMNTTGAEVTGTDNVDVDANGFKVKNSTLTNISGVTYLFLAIS